MNKIYKTIWSKTQETFVAVSEASSSRTTGKCETVSIVFPMGAFALLMFVPIVFGADALDNSTLGNNQALLIGEISSSFELTVDVNVIPSEQAQNLVYSQITNAPNGIFINGGNSLTLGGALDDNFQLADGAVWVYGIANNDGATSQSTLTLGFEDCADTKGSLGNLYVQ